MAKLKGPFPDRTLSDMPYEVLYGHAGYLYALLFVGSLVPGGLDENLIEREVSLILDAGHRGSRLDGSPSPLMFTWHGKHYLGAAHGLAGILTVLLQVSLLEHLSQQFVGAMPHTRELAETPEQASSRSYYDC